jgi:long-chain-fatty-acid--CoA ligase ACSBG
MISHDQIIFEGAAMLKTIGDSVAFGRDGQERILSYLPLSHVAGMMIDIICPVYTTSDGPGHCTLYFARPYDLKVGAIKDRLCVAKPTLFLGVPLVWERIADKIRAIGAANTGVKKAFGDWAKGVSLQNAQSKQLGNELVEPVGLTIASKLLSKVKEGLGLDELKFGLTGAAPIRVDTLEYFGSLGLGIYEVYGMSECCGAATVSIPQAHQWGSCGYEMHGVEVKAFIVDPTDINKKVECPRSPGLGDTEETYQGELCYRGRSIMMGYMAQPDLGAAHVQEIEKKTADTIDAAGWLHSGDKGMITKDGMVKITGRYKELIIGEGGENIAPVPIEDHVKKMCDGIAEVMMVGDKRKYNVALITLKAIGANGEQPGTDMLDAGAKRVNPDVSTISGAMKDKAWIDAVWAAINSANENGKVCFNNAAKIQKFTILPLNFSEQTNELTPTKKLKRKVVETSYAAVIEKMYAAKGPYVEFSH